MLSNGVPPNIGEIARTLTEAYRLRGNGAPLSPSATPSLAEAVAIIDIYSAETTVHATEIVATERLGLVLTGEAAVVDGQRKTWSAIHVWRFDAGHVSRFEAYAQTLVVLPPGVVAAD